MAVFIAVLLLSGTFCCKYSVHVFVAAVAVVAVVIFPKT